VPFVLSLHEALGAELIDFDCTHCLPSEQFASENASASARE